MTVYLLHLSQPLSRGVSKRGTALIAGHYIGFTDDLESRLADHANGNGARFTQVCVERGITWQVVRTWPGGGRSFERQLKKQKHARLFCPVCNPNAMKNMERSDHAKTH